MLTACEAFWIGTLLTRNSRSPTLSPLASTTLPGAIAETCVHTDFVSKDTPSGVSAGPLSTSASISICVPVHLWQCVSSRGGRCLLRMSFVSSSFAACSSMFCAGTLA